MTAGTVLVVTADGQSLQQIEQGPAWLAAADALVELDDALEQLDGQDRNRIGRVRTQLEDRWAGMATGHPVPDPAPPTQAPTHPITQPPARPAPTQHGRTS